MKEFRRGAGGCILNFTFRMRTNYNVKKKQVRVAIPHVCFAETVTLCTYTTSWDDIVTLSFYFVKREM